MLSRLSAKNQQEERNSRHYDIITGKCIYPNDKYENHILDVFLPGIEKKDISLKLTEDSFYVAANKAGVKYLDSYFTCCPVAPEKAKVKYANGVLKVTVPYQKPLEKLVYVKID